MFESRNDVTSITERRAHPGLPVHSLAPIDLGTGAPGTMNNIAEGGLAGASAPCAERTFSDSWYTVLPANIREFARNKRPDRVA